MTKRLPLRSPQNKGAKLPLLVPKPPGSGIAGVFDQVLNPDRNSISRQLPEQSQHNSSGVQAALWPPMPPHSQSANHLLPPRFLQIPCEADSTLSQGLPFNEWKAVYEQVYSQAYQIFEGTQQGFKTPPSHAPVAGPSYSNTEVQLPVPPPGEVIDLTADDGDDTLRCSSVRAPEAPPSETYLRAAYQPAFLNAHMPAVPLDVNMPGQDVSGYQAPYASHGRSLPHAYSHESHCQGNLTGATGSVGNSIDPLLAPAPVRPFMLNGAFNQSFTSGISEPTESLADARAGKRRRETAEAAHGVIGEGPSHQVKKQRYARRAQDTAEDGHANAERAATATTVELERRSREEAHEALPAESRREEVPEEGVQGDDKVNEAQGSDHDQGEQSSVHRQDSGFHEQNSNGEEGDSEETAEPEPADRGNNGAPHRNEVTPENDFSDLLNLDMFK